MPFRFNTIVTGSKTDSHPTPLKIGVMLDSSHVPGWMYYVIEKLTSCKTIDPVFIILAADSRVAPRSDRSPILFRFWAALDRWLRQSKTDALQLRDCGSLWKSHSIPVLLVRKDNNQALSEVDIAPIKAAKLDLLLYLGRDVPRAEIATCASQATWWVQQENLCGEAVLVPDQFWDMYEGNRVTTYGPQIVEQRKSWIGVVHRSSCITNFLSLALNQNAAFWEIARVLIAQVSDEERLRTGKQPFSETNTTRRSMSRTLSNTRMAAFLVQWTGRILSHALKKLLFREQWSIVLQPKADIPKVSFEHDLKIIRPPRDCFYADPFLVGRSGHTYLFFEDYKFASGKGLISCCEVSADGSCSKPRVVLERKYHLSYPFLFTWQGELYMIPETRDNGTIELYRASDFPYAWVHEAVLMSEIAATDSTLLHYKDKWWLFTAGVLDHASPNEKLFLFFADSPLGPWIAHPKNPIVSDARHARPAGSLYFDNGQLIRPGQDCSMGYGYATQLHRVSVLSETDYHETLLTSIPPDRIPGSKGIHTFNQNGEFWVVDCKFLIGRFDFSSVSSIFQRVGSSVWQLVRP